MTQQRAEALSEVHRQQLPDDAEQFSLGLGDDAPLTNAKLIAGVLSVAAVVAMLITSLFRAPNTGWTVVLGVLAVGLSVAIIAQVARRRADGRR